MGESYDVEQKKASLREIHQMRFYLNKAQQAKPKYIAQRYIVIKKKAK